MTLSCAELDENTIDILYHLDKDLKLISFRLTVPRNAAIPSISPVYFAAFLVENEIQDLFDIRFTGLAIDYERTLYLEEEVKITPFCKYSISEAKKQKPISSSTAGGSCSGTGNIGSKNRHTIRPAAPGIAGTAAFEAHRRG